MIVDFLEFLKRGKGRFAFVATYEFDPLFFERRMLCTPAFSGAPVIVFVDADRYRHILAAGRQGPDFDRDYFVVPIERLGGVFHPKLYLSLGEKKIIASIGSNNCTPAGTGHNFELISTLETSIDADPKGNASLIRAIFQQLERYAAEAGALAKWLKRDIFEPAKAACPWLATVEEEGAATPEISLLSSHDRPLWPQIVARMAGQDVSSILLLAPFFDAQLGMVERMRALWPAATIQIVSQSRYSNLPVQRLVELRDKLRNIELLSAIPQQAGRNMHAKALAFQTADCTYWLAGSANMSLAALAGGNSEACLWFVTKQPYMKALKQDELLFAPIAPDDFVSAPIDEPEAPSDEPSGLSLSSLVLTEDGKLLVGATIPATMNDLTLRIIKRGDVLPTFSWRIDGSGRDIALALKEDDLAKFDRPAVGQLRGIVEGDEATSQLCSVTQLARLLRDRGSGSASGNRLQRVMETGEGLIEYVDALDGIDAAIDFMTNTNIRFSDDNYGGGGSGGQWRARDPFSGDLPDHWAIGSSGGTITELRAAIWDFVQRHIRTRLERHVARGNLGGLPNFLDIFRTLSRLLLTWHNRQIEGEAVIPHPYLTTGIQAILATLIGSREGDESEDEGFGKAVLANLEAEESLVRTEFDRHRVSALARATVDEMIRARAIALKRAVDDDWSRGRRDWVMDWTAGMNLAGPNEADLHDIGAEFRLAA